MSQGKAFIAPLDVAQAIAASRIAPGLLVKRSGDGTVLRNSATNEQMMGCAGDLSLANDAEPGFFSAYEPVPVCTVGRVRLRLLGGGSDCTGGMWVAAIRDGLVEIESGGDRAQTSVAKCVAAEDIEVSNYSCTPSAAVAGTKTLTVDATTYFAKGDYVNIKDDNASENNLITRIVSSTVVRVANVLRATYTTGTVEMSKHVECEAILQ